MTLILDSKRKTYLFITIRLLSLISLNYVRGPKALSMTANAEWHVFIVMLSIMAPL